MVCILGHRESPGAEAALIPGMIRITLYLNEFVVLNMCQHATAAVTTRASGPSGGPDNFDLLTPHFPEILHLIVSQKVPICHPELVSGFLNSLILLDAELGQHLTKKGLSRP